jgi:dextranase
MNQFLHSAPRPRGGLRAATTIRRLLASALLLCALLASSAALAQSLAAVNTDKARYNPGQTVTFTASIASYASGLSLVVQYYQGGNLLSTQPTITPTSGTVTWQWTPAATDYQGYLVGLTLKQGTTTLSTTSIGVDVSSDWARFPRYGFLSAYPSMTDGDMDAVMNQLNRYHLNSIQFYDWMDKHHRPLAGTAAAPAAQWNDLANRTTVFQTIKGYIDRGHTKNMNSLFYSLIYGAYPTAASDGVDLSGWGLYNDQAHTSPWYNGNFPSNWESQGLNILNPANTSWRSYFLNEVGKVYDAANLHFDGWHIDQLGDGHAKYDSQGNPAAVDQAFGPFITAAKNARPDKKLVMNAVNQYGQSGIAAAPVDITYSEVWDNEGYVNLGGIIQKNEQLAPGKRTVLAAYVNRDRSNGPGTFNDASVLMADATIFAFGGAHIELGEHMLGNEYFPNSNLQMSADLQQAITRYYDFAVAYENLLRDQGRQFTNVTLSGGSNVQAWPPVQGKIATVGTATGGTQVFQLLNYSQAQTMSWRDNSQVQPVPTTQTNLSLSFPFSTPIAKVWTASPDVNNGLPQQLNNFSQKNGIVTVTLPSLQYWAMLVAEPGTTSTPTTPPLTAYFKKPASWGTPNIHYWNTLPVGSSTTWPGVPMKAAPEVGNNWYSYTFAAGTTSANFVFDNNGDNATKTVDLYRDKTGYYDYATATWSDVPPISIYFKKPASWGTPDLHYWNTQPQNTSSTWPGVVMTAAPELGSNWYSYTLPAGTTSTNLVFDNNGDNVTKTIDLYRDKTGYYDYTTGTWSNTLSSNTSTSNARVASLAATAGSVVLGLELSQNVPNPFAGATTIRYTQPTDGPVSLTVYDLSGRQVRALLDQAQQKAGEHTVELPGDALAAGVYLYQLQTAAGSLTRRMVKIN